MLIILHACISTYVVGTTCKTESAIKVIDLANVKPAYVICETYDEYILLKP